jgi:hypothetical protein
MMMSRNFSFIGACGLFVMILLAGFPGVQAQDTWRYSDGTPINTADERVETAAMELPRQFRSLYLGMSLDDLKTALLKDSYFNFRGDRDVSLLPSREQSLVETSGSLFIRRAFFQFRDGELFIMALVMDVNQVDHYSIFTNFTAKYGEPTYLDPTETVWENDDTRIAIERPLTVKYIDKRVFNDIIDESAVNDLGRVQLRQDFLDEF